MNIYAESSAVLAWLFAEARAPEVRAIFADAEAVIASDLTLIESDRAIWRSVALDMASEAQAGELKRRLAHYSAHWEILPFAPQIIARARLPFPGEPIRTLDALHVASALHARAAYPDLALLSLDERVRRVARSLGLSVMPS